MANRKSPFRARKTTVRSGHQAPAVVAKNIPANGQPQKSPADILYPGAPQPANVMGQ